MRERLDIELDKAMAGLQFKNNNGFLKLLKMCVSNTQ